MFDLYKPLRNRLRQYDAASGLFAAYAFMQFIHFDRPLPANFQTPQMRWNNPLQLGLFEWEFDTLAREVLANSPTYASKKLYRWKDVVQSVNLIKDIENGIWGRQPDSENKVLYEVLRIAHRQFPWQDKVRQSDLVRYLKIYRQPGICDLVHRVFGLLPDEVFNVGLALTGHFLQSFASDAPITSSLPGVDPDAAARLATHLTRTLEEHRNAVSASQTYDINWAYNPNHLRRYPLVQLNERTIVCPIMPFLLSWLVDSIYFDLVQHGDEFSRSFGEAFQSYVGEALRAADHEKSFEVISESRYGSRRRPKDSIDWILSDKSGALFIECKATRMKLRGKIDLTSIDTMRSELERIAAFVVQAYSTLNDAMRGEYDHWKPGERSAYPLVVTLENWRAMRFPAEEIVDTKVKKLFEQKGLDTQLLDDHPYQVCSVAELEVSAQMMSQIGIEPFMKKKREHGAAKTTMHGFLAGLHGTPLRACVTDLFPDDWEAISNSLGR